MMAKTWTVGMKRLLVVSCRMQCPYTPGIEAWHRDAQGLSGHVGDVSCGFIESGYITSYTWRAAMSTTAQRRALKEYRSRLTERGMARFEVMGLDADRELVRALARRLAEEGPEAAQIRSTMQQAIAGEPPRKGGILEALRRSPLVGADLDLARPREEGRRIDL
jgi:hypothetical protein